MNTVQNVPLWTARSVTPSLFSLFVSFRCLVKFSREQGGRHRTRSEKHGGRERHGNSPTSVQQHTIEESRESKKQKQHTKRNKLGPKSLLFMRKRRASLLTCTIKASFAKKKWRSLFLGGQKVENVCSRSAPRVSRGWVRPQQGTLLSRAQTV